MGQISIFIDAMEVGKQLSLDSQFAAEVFNEMAYRFGDEEHPPGAAFLKDFLEYLDDEGRYLLRALAKAAAAAEADETAGGA